VCKRFRELIISTSGLWKSVDFKFPLELSKENLQYILCHSRKINELHLPCTTYKCSIPETDWVFTRSNFNSLVWLNLSEAPISTLCFLYGAPNLMILDLSGCKHLFDEDFYVLKSCHKLEQLYLGFTHVKAETLETICRNKALSVVDACEIYLQIDHCRNILENTIGHIVYLHISLHTSVLFEDFKSQILNQYLDTSVRVFNNE
jgi:hypothetical protein